MAENTKIALQGRVFIRFELEAVTGLHIGGSDAGIEIGGVDKTVIRDPLTNRPYIPGSSVKGKMRSLLEKYGYDGLPIYAEPTEGPLGSPELYKTYRLVLNSGARLQSAFRSQHLNIPGLLKLQPKPQVLINPMDAKARGISNQDRVWVESPRGRVGVWARVTGDVMTGQVELNVGGGSPIHAEEWREANANMVTDFENRDPISGFPVYKALLCEVKKRD